MRFAPRDIPGGDSAAYFAASIAAIPCEFETLVAVSARYEQLAEALSWIVHATIDTEADPCTIRLRANKLDQLVTALVGLALGASVQVIEPRAVADEVDKLAGRLSGSKDGDAANHR